MNQHTLIIAEAGVNHDGSLDKAMTLVDAAAKAGADVVKFQTFRSELLVTGSAEQADYQKSSSPAKSQYEMLKALELSPEDFVRLKKHAEHQGITFLSSPFDTLSLRFLLDDLKLPTIKFGSGELTNAPLLYEAAQSGVQLILSTGMSSLEEIQQTLGVLAFAYHQHESGSGQKPSLDGFRAAFDSSDGQELLRKHVSILHCTTEYPAPWESVNLLAMETLQQKFGLNTGFSDHTPGIEASLAAVAMGATIIEKHFTLDTESAGPDHKASLNPEQLCDLVSGIRNIERAKGSATKALQASEAGNVQVARKSLVASCGIKKGELFTENNLTCKRPGTGMSPMLIWDLLGKPSSKDYLADDLIAEGYWLK